MSTVTITGNVRDISRTADPAEIRFWTPTVRDGVLSTRRRKVNPDPVTGAFSIALEAGLTSCLIGTKVYTFTTTADADLDALIQLEQAVPPSAAADRLTAAVNAWATAFGDGRYARVGAGAPFQFVQATPAATWTVNHNLGHYPASVSIILPSGEVVDTDVAHPSVTQTVITFPTPTSGRAVLI